MTLGILYYEGPQMLQKQLSVWQSYPDWVKEQLEFVVVDDGSPDNPARNIVESHAGSLSVQLYRIMHDYPWNTGGTRNLIMYAVSHNWVLMMDLDHVIDRKNIEKLLDRRLESGKVYKFQRFSVSRNKFIGGHGESMLIEKDLYWKAGGYDEDFLEYKYGGERFFFKQLNGMAEGVRFDDIYLAHYSRAVISDSEANGRVSVRANSIPAHLLQQKKGYYKPMNPLRFEWEKICG